MEKIKILIAEDDDLMQSMIKDALKDVKFDLTVAADGIAGWLSFQQSEFDMVLLDLKLPKMDGITLLKKIKGLSPETIAIMMTAYGTVETAVEAMKHGAFDYISKPFLAEELLLLIEKGLEVQNLKEENRLLKQELHERYALGSIIGKCKPMQDIYRLIEIVAQGTATVLIQGESGTGKELIAEAIHHSSLRKDKTLVKVSCAALPEKLLESELFGHEKGAFTDAIRRKIGRFELAHRGTLFLDDVDDMNPNVQVKLLRFLQEKEFERVGGTEIIKVDVRIVAASKISLQQAVQEGKFREDLYYRLNVVPIVLPPLRERKEDIPLLVQHFIDKVNRENKKTVRIHPSAMDRLLDYHWPGNIRELENLIERMVVVSVKNQILSSDLPDELGEKKEWHPASLKSVVHENEKDHIQKVLEMTGGKKKESARILNITPKTLWQKMKEYGIQ